MADLLAEVDRLRALLARVRPDVVREESIDAIDEALGTMTEGRRRDIEAARLFARTAARLDRERG